MRLKFHFPVPLRYNKKAVKPAAQVSISNTISIFMCDSSVIVCMIHCVSYITTRTVRSKVTDLWEKSDGKILGKERGIKQ